MELSDKRILIAGAGVSGIGAAQLLGRAGLSATIYDGNIDLDKETIRSKVPEDMKLDFVLGEVTPGLSDRFDLLIMSPGIPTDKPIARVFYEKKKPVWGEIELAYHFSKGRIAAITGTNGKTTTTALVGRILEEYYSSVFVVGNIGIPYTSVAHRCRDQQFPAGDHHGF